MEKFRGFTEQVSHHPPISAYSVEGENYSLEGYAHLDQSFEFGGGAGRLAFVNNGVWKYELSKYGDLIEVTKPPLQVNNIIFGTIYLDIDGKLTGRNQDGHYIDVSFTTKGWTTDSTLSGYGYNKDGTKLWEISGSWLEKVVIKNLRTKETEVLWTNEAIKYPEESARMYNMTNFAILLNHLPEDIKENTLLPRTDSRFRPDTRAYENGDLNEADG